MVSRSWVAVFALAAISYAFALESEENSNSAPTSAACPDLSCERQDCVWNRFVIDEHSCETCECEDQCPPTMVWMECGSPCTLTCEYPLLQCMAVCEARCQCPRDKPLLHNGECVSSDQCDDPCSIGNALNDDNGVHIFCGRGPSRQSCPDTHVCNIHPGDAGAVCCEIGTGNPCHLALQSTWIGASYPGRYVPRCDADGFFLSKQCETDSDMCWCVTPDGARVEGTETSAEDGRIFECDQVPSITCPEITCDRQDCMGNRFKVDDDGCQTCECEEECPPTTVWKDCGSACTPTCEEQEIMCMMMCVAKCECPSDKPLMHNGECVSAEQCDSAERTCPDITCERQDCVGNRFKLDDDGCSTCECEEECPSTLVWKDCGSTCTPTCEEPVMLCNRMCEARCECPSGKPLMQNGECVSAEQCIPEVLSCPDPTCDRQDCVGNRFRLDDDGCDTCDCEEECPSTLVWRDCGSTCTPTCEVPIMMCNMMCEARCECPSDKPLMHNGECVSADQCDSAGRICPDITCERQDCVENRFKLDDDGCRTCECEEECPSTLVWKDCGSACTPTCEEQEIMCMMMCVAKCECPSDKPLMHNGECVSAEQCDSVERICPDITCERQDCVGNRFKLDDDDCSTCECEEECPSTLVWKDCGSTCTPTCEEPVMICNRMCDARCECPSDKPLMQNGECVSAEQCIPEEPSCPDLSCEIQACISNRFKIDDDGCQTCECEEECPPTLVWTDCGSPCTPTCEEQDIPCILSCEARCECPSDKPLLHNGECVSADQCDTDPCHIGDALVDESGEQIFCGRGLNRRDCPDTHVCNAHPLDRGAVCCDKITGGPCHIATQMIWKGDSFAQRVPQCDPRGNYLRMQCDDEEDMCWCVTPDGMEIEGSQTSREDGEPQCYGEYQCPTPMCMPLQCVNNKLKIDERGCEICECEEACPKGMVWNSCGSPCDTTCASLGLPMPCITMCEAKCECPQDRPILHEGKCITSDMCEYDPCYMGRAFVDEMTGERVSCSSDGNECPESYVCNVNPSSSEGVCCDAISGGPCHLKQQTMWSHDNGLPQCTSNGFYASMQCMSDNECWCSTQNGQIIQNVDVDTSDEAMKCIGSEPDTCDDITGCPMGCVPEYDDQMCIRCNCEDPCQIARCDEDYSCVSIQVQCVMAPCWPQVMCMPDKCFITAPTDSQEQMEQRWVYSSEALGCIQRSVPTSDDGSSIGFMDQEECSRSCQGDQSLFCPDPFMCNLECEHGRREDPTTGCELCQCQCPKMKCMVNCRFGFKRDEAGCEICKCENPCEGVRCEDYRMQCVPVQETCDTPPCRVETECLPSLAYLPTLCLEAVQQSSEMDCGKNETRFYYDTTRRDCATFQDRGCNRGRNNFASREECLESCHIDLPPPMCRPPICPTGCETQITEGPDGCSTCECVDIKCQEMDSCEAECTYGFKQDSNGCLLCECNDPCQTLNCAEDQECMVQPGECEGDTCPRARCVMQRHLLPNACTQMLDDEDCGESLNRVFYNETARQCQEFIYGGCYRSENNFESMEACEDICEGTAETICSPMLCPADCRTTVEQDDNGCDVCRCEQLTCPPIFDCILDCQYGLLTNEDGCEICQCACSRRMCRMYCQYGFKTDEHGCEICECVRPCEGVTCDDARLECMTRMDDCDKSQTCSPTAECIPKMEYLHATCKAEANREDCGESIEMYYFDSQSRTCKEFTHGDCDGSENTFDTMEDCNNQCNVTTCALLDECTLECPMGYKTEEDTGCEICECNTCEPVRCRMYCQFGWQKDENGCDMCKCVEPCEDVNCEDGRRQCWPRQTECDQRPCPTYTECVPRHENLRSMCTDPADSDDCGESRGMVYYDSGTRMCKEFTYGGCDETANKFETREECHDVCNTTVCQSLDECTLDCPIGYVVDQDTDCEICECKVCEPVRCRMYCQFGWQKDEDGCDICECVDPCEDVECEDEKRQCWPRQTECDQRPCPTYTECVPRHENLRSMCTDPADSDDCGESRGMAYYDSGTRMCKEFTYGGCDETANKFETMEECYDVCNTTVCQSLDECTLDCPIGYVLDEDTDCEICECKVCEPVRCRMYCQFGWKKDEDGCDICECVDPCEDVECEDEKRQCWPRQTECDQRPCPTYTECVPRHENLRSMCTDPADSDDCGESRGMVYYDSRTRMCKEFTYGGCDETANKFETMEECYDACNSTACQPLDECILDCPIGYKTEEDTGCEICECKVCEPVRCRMYCQFGWKKDEDGCDICECVDPCEDVECEDGRRQCWPRQTECDQRPCPTYTECVPRHENLRSMCTDPADNGDCGMSGIDMFYYDSMTRMCKEFTYTGCDETNNKFESLDMCNDACNVTVCPSLDDCSSTDCPGGYMMDTDTGCETCECRCEPVRCRMYCEFGWAKDENGCDMCQCVEHPCQGYDCPVGEECILQEQRLPTCAPIGIAARCLLPMDSGPCEGDFIRWHYDVTARRCVSFSYGGCEGNDNTFRFQEECEDTCHVAMCPEDREDCYVSQCRHGFMRDEERNCERCQCSGPPCMTCDMDCMYGFNKDHRDCDMCDHCYDPCREMNCGFEEDCVVKRVPCEDEECSMPDMLIGVCVNRLLSEQCVVDIWFEPVDTFGEDCDIRWAFDPVDMICYSPSEFSCSDNGFGSEERCQSTCMCPQVESDLFCEFGHVFNAPCYTSECNHDPCIAMLCMVGHSCQHVQKDRDCVDMCELTAVCAPVEMAKEDMVCDDRNLERYGSICSRTCNMNDPDNSCPGDAKCCSTGCGFACLPPRHPRLDTGDQRCYDARDVAMAMLRTDPSRDVVVPFCESGNVWAAVQCSLFNNMCWCVEESSGKMIPGTKKRGTIPNCQAIQSNIRDEEECEQGTTAEKCNPLNCLYAYCPAHPNAQCRISRCGSCDAVFYDNNRELSDDDCFRGYDTCREETLDTISSLGQVIINNIRRANNTVDEYLAHFSTLHRQLHNYVVMIQGDADDIPGRPDRPDRPIDIPEERGERDDDTWPVNPSPTGGRGGQESDIEQDSETSGDRRSIDLPEREDRPMEMPEHMGESTPRSDEFPSGPGNRPPPGMEGMPPPMESSSSIPANMHDIHIFLPKCRPLYEDLHAGYEFKQCFEAFCWCVDHRGNPIAGTLTTASSQLTCTQSGRDVSRSAEPYQCSNGNQPEICKSCFDLYVLATMRHSEDRISCQADPCDYCNNMLFNAQGEYITLMDLGYRVQACMMGSDDQECLYSVQGSGALCSDPEYSGYLPCSGGRPADCTSEMCEDMCTSDAECVGFPEAQCMTDPCTCERLYIDVVNNQYVDCSAQVGNCARYNYVIENAMMTSRSDIDDEDMMLMSCNEDGEFMSVQCHGSECWCVLANGEEIVDTRSPRRDDFSCDSPGPVIIDITFVFANSFDTISNDIDRFTTSFREAFADMMRLPVEWVHINKVRPGSVIVETEVVVPEEEKAMQDQVVLSVMEMQQKENTENTQIDVDMGDVVIPLMTQNKTSFTFMNTVETSTPPVDMRSSPNPTTRETGSARTTVKTEAPPVDIRSSPEPTHAPSTPKTEKLSEDDDATDTAILVVAIVLLSLFLILMLVLVSWKKCPCFKKSQKKDFYKTNVNDSYTYANENFKGPVSYA